MNIHESRQYIMKVSVATLMIQRLFHDRGKEVTLYEYF
jgi:hypothetical protein